MMEDNEILNEINENLKFIKNQLSLLLTEKVERSETTELSNHSNKIENTTSLADFQKLADALNVESARINEIIDIDGTEVRLIKVIDGNKESIGANDDVMFKQ